jgi:hypothetical protein
VLELYEALIKVPVVVAARVSPDKKVAVILAVADVRFVALKSLTVKVGEIATAAPPCVYATLNDSPPIVGSS